MKKLVLATALLGTSLNVFANGVSTTDAADAPIIAKFAELGVTVKQINPSPVAGLKELITDKLRWVDYNIPKDKQFGKVELKKEEPEEEKPCI